MSIATLSARVHSMTPQDELIGSLTKERIALAVRYAGAQSLEGTEAAKHWLAYALGTDVPLAFHTLANAFDRREQLEDCDLDFWYDMPNTEDNRVAMKAKAEHSIDYCVRGLTTQLCLDLGVTA